MIRRTLILVALLALGCASEAPGGDASAGGDDIDSGRALRDAGCGPITSGPEPGCVMETCFGGRQCVNGPCELPCCVDGRLEVCELANGSECNVPPPMDCGGGTCVPFGNPCR